MNIEKNISAGAIGTTAMTLFSYAVSESKDKNFKEPKVLGILIDRILPTTEKKVAKSTGWVLHYGMGLAFTSVYDYIWKKTGVKPTVKNGLILGGISSLIGIAAWDLIFKMHPNPPVIHLKRYYGHLVLAHLIFGAVAALTYKNVNRK